MSDGAASLGYEELDIHKMELIMAAHEGNLTKVADLLDNAHVHVDSFDDDHVTALQAAATAGHQKMVTYLLSKGANLDKCNQVGMTPFHHACREGKLAVVEILLQRGADIHRTTFVFSLKKNAFSYLGASALTLATAGGHMEVVKKLIGLRVALSSPRPGLCPSPLIAAVYRSHIQILSFLVGRGAPVNERNDSLYGLTALSCSVVLSATTALRALLDLGADPNIISLKNHSARSLAQSLSKQEVLSILNDRTRHFPVKAQDLREWILTGRIEDFEAAIAKAQSLPTFADGTTLLHFASTIDNVAAARRILEIDKESGILNARERKFGCTALMIASLLREPEICSLLLSKRASTTEATATRFSLDFDLKQKTMSAFDLYVVSNEDHESQLRAQLHPYRPKNAPFTPLQLSGTTRSISKMFSQGVKKMELLTTQFATTGFDRSGGGLGGSSGSSSGSGSTGCVNQVTQKDWLYHEIKTRSTEGRNDKKLVLVEEILSGAKSLCPPRAASLDDYVDVARRMANESSSFALVTFYDRFASKPAKKDDDSIKMLTDPALKYASEYGYNDQHRAIPIHQREQSDSSSYTSLKSPRPRIAEWSASASSSGSVHMRTTPRMLKKSRENLSTSSERPPDSPQPHQFTFHAAPAFRLPQSSYLLPDHGLYKSSSTPQLNSSAPIRRSVPSSPRVPERRKTLNNDLLWREMSDRGLGQYVQRFRELEIDLRAFLLMSEAELLSNVGVVNSGHLQQLVDIQEYFKALEKH